VGEYVKGKERTKLSADKIVILSVQKGLEGEANRLTFVVVAFVEAFFGRLNRLVVVVRRFLLTFGIIYRILK